MFLTNAPAIDWLIPRVLYITRGGGQGACADNKSRGRTNNCCVVAYAVVPNLSPTQLIYAGFSGSKLILYLEIPAAPPQGGRSSVWRGHIAQIYSLLYGATSGSNTWGMSLVTRVYA